MATLSKTLPINNKLGLHARAAARLVKTASEFDADVAVEKDGKQVSGKSMMGLMMLAAGKGSEVTVTAEGEDAEQALGAIEQLLADKFGEES